MFNWSNGYTDDYVATPVEGVTEIYVAPAQLLTTASGDDSTTMSGNDTTMTGDQETSLQPEEGESKASIEGLFMSAILVLMMIFAFSG